MKTTNRFFAFPLAEVFITLGIIGVVAAMTIPTLIQNANEKATVVALKKAYSVLSQAYTLAVNENGTPDTWNLTGDAAGNTNLINAVAPYLKLTKNCYQSSGCFNPGVKYKQFNGTVRTAPIDNELDSAKAQLSDGTLLKTWAYGNNVTVGNTLALQSVSGTFMVDVNGNKPPNQTGVDTFEFYVTKYGIIPRGTAAETIANGADDATFNVNCKDKATANGNGCTAWVIYNENMDYLKCADLSWTGKTKCD